MRFTSQVAGIALASLALTLIVPMINPPAAAAVPGVPGPVSLLYDEGFDNGMGAPVGELGSYVGSSGTTYTADPIWLRYDNCNGVIVRYDSATFVPGTPPAGQCTQGNAAQSQANVRRFADVLGQVDAGVVGGTSDASPVNGSTAATRTNHAVGEWTSAISGAANQIVMQTSTLNLNVPNTRFLNVSMDIAEASCTYLGGANTSRLDFFLNIAGTETKLNADPVRACVDAGVGTYTSNCLAAGTPATCWGTGGASVRAGRFFLDQGRLITPAEADALQVIVRNQVGTSDGNDHALDNLRIYDASPTLDKEFSPASIPQGETSLLTFTVTNTEEGGAKNGWQFVDNLAAGLTASGPLGGTCDVTASTISAQTIDVTGNLASGQISCTITIPVTSDLPGDYTNSGSNLPTLVGLNPPGTAPLTVLPVTSLSITKSANVESHTPGLGISYTVTVGNAGPSDAAGAIVTDQLPAEISGASWTCAVTAGTASCGAAAGSGDLADTAQINAGGELTYTITGTVAAGTTGNLTNTATVVGPESTVDTGCPAAPGAGCSASVTTLGSAIAVAKSITSVTDSNGNELTDTGDVIHYSMVATNTGQSTLTGVVLTDQLSAPAGPALSLDCVPGSPATLAPTEVLTCTADYLITLADTINGAVDNEATATGTPPDGPEVSDTDTQAQQTVASPGISLAKSVDPSTVTAAGQVVTYSFDVANTGNVPLTSINVTEVDFTGTGAAPAISCPGGTLQPQTIITCSATYAVTQADIDAGVLDNTAQAHGTPPVGPEIDSGTSSVQLLAAPEPAAISIMKSATPTGVFAAGQTITYSFDLTNVGGVTLAGVNVTDVFTSGGSASMTPITCADTTLAPDESTLCIATYTVDAADLAVDQLDNTATAHGTPPTGPEVTASSSATVRILRPGLNVVKSSVPSSGTTVMPGDVVNYTLTFSNSGQAPGTVDYTDALAGVLDDAMLTTAPVASGPGLVASAVIDDAFTVTGTLQPGDSVTVTYGVTVRAADLGDLSLQNFVLITGDPVPTQCPPDDPLCTVHPVSISPELILVKSADPAAVNVAGELVTYRFQATNGGDVDLTGLTISDVFTPPGGTGAFSPISCVATDLAPGASTDCTASYAVAQVDLDLGLIENTATAQAIDPTGGEVDSDASTVIVTASPAAPAIEVVKSGVPSGIIAADQEIDYTFDVTNTGGVTLTGIEVTDVFTSGGTGAMTPILCADTTLAPNASTNCTATYTTNAADMTAGTIDNTATAHGTPPTGPEVTDTDSAIVDVLLPGINVVKSVAPTSTTSVTPGQVLAYTLTFSNTGQAPGALDYTDALTDVLDDASLSALPVADAALTVSPVVDQAFRVTGTLAPDDVVAVTFQVTVNSSGFGNLSLGNVVTVTGGPAPVDCVEGDALCTVNPVVIAPELSLVKSASPTIVTAAGDEVTYAFQVTNTGDVDLTDLALADDFTPPGGTGPLSAISCLATDLAVGEATDCAATYGVVQADLDAGVITNTATAKAIDPTGQAVDSAEATAAVTATPSPPALELIKTASPMAITAAGEEIVYAYKVTNTGGVTLSNVAVTDVFTSGGTGPLSPISCVDTVLAPQQTTTCTATYTTVAADLGSGGIDNTATAHGTPPANAAEVTATDSASVDVLLPMINASKSVDPGSTTTVSPGAVLSYTLTFSNSGQALGVVDYTDELADVLDDAVLTGQPTSSELALTVSAVTGDRFSVTGILEPGESVIVTYQVTVKTGGFGNLSLGNFVVVTGESPPPDCATSNTLCTVNPVAIAPELSLVKSAIPGTVTSAGEVVTYSFAVVNSGDVDLTELSLADLFTPPGGSGSVSPISCPATDLAVGAGIACTATYAVGQADIDAGLIHNTATAQAVDPTGTAITSESSTAVVLATPAAAAIEIVKTASPTAITAAGQAVSYSFGVTNLGGVTLTEIEVTDEFSQGGSGDLSPIACGATTLAPNASTTCLATYTTDQADLSSGGIANLATAHGTTPAGAEVTAADSAVVEVLLPAITVIKSVDPVSTTTVGPGQILNYTLTLTNAGQAPGAVSYTDHLGDVLDDGALTGAPASSDPAIAVTPVADRAFKLSGTLAPNAVVTISYQVSVNRAPLGNLNLTNFVTASGAEPPTECVSENPLCTTNPVVIAPSLSLAKTAEPATINGSGEDVAYTFSVTNTGDVDLTNLIIVDTFTRGGSGELSAISCAATDLAVGAAATCTATYSVAQADIDLGRLENSAIAQATSPTGQPVSSPAASAVVTAIQTPGIKVVKSTTTAEISAAGQVIPFEFRVSNTGNVTLVDVTVHDLVGLPGVPANLGPITCGTNNQANGEVELAPGESITCAADYTVTEEDYHSPEVVNSATATGNSGCLVLADLAIPAVCEPVVSEPSAARVPVRPAPAITVQKSTTTTEVTQIGQRVVFSFLLRNVGNVALSEVEVIDTVIAPSVPANLGPISCSANELNGTITLSPGESISCSATYTVSEADLRANQVSDVAVVRATPPTGPKLTSPGSPVVLPVEPSPPDELPDTGALGTFGWLVAVGALVLLGAALTVGGRRPLNQ